MSKQISDHAHAAKIIRKQLKAWGIDANVRARSFSMGDAVDVDVVDLAGEKKEMVIKFINQFQYGRFDGMQDIYEYTNKREDIPQVKYVQFQNTISDMKAEEIYTTILKQKWLDDSFPATYQAAKNLYVNNACCYVSGLMRREFYK